MRRIGLITGMSWESDENYLTLINAEVRRKLGPNHTAKTITFAYDFQDVLNTHKKEGWGGMAAMAADAAKKLERSGAGMIILCTNTIHKVALSAARAVSVSLIHIADATSEALQRGKVTNCGLLGTRFTLSDPYFRDRLKDRYTGKVFIPEPETIESINSFVYEELLQGIVRDESKERMSQIVANMKMRGADGIVVACPELMQLIDERRAGVRIFESTSIHASAAARFALTNG